MSKKIINLFNKGGIMHKRSLLIYGLAVVVLIAVGGLVWYLNRSSADLIGPDGQIIKTATIFGLVTDESTAIRSGVYVVLSQKGVSDSARNEYTNDQGIYRFEVVPYGTYILEAGGNMLTTDCKAFKATIDPLKVELKNIDQDIILKSEDINMAAVQGFIYNEERKPLEGVKVKAETRMPSGNIISRGEMTSDKNGYYLSGCNFQPGENVFFIAQSKEQNKIIPSSGLHWLENFELKTPPGQPNGDQGGTGGQSEGSGANPGVGRP